MMQNNKTLMFENKKIYDDKIQLKQKINDLYNEIKKLKGNFVDEKIKIEKELKSDEETLLHFLLYFKYQKNKNKKHRNIINKHKDCDKCKKNENPNKFFSFNITSQIIIFLKKRGLSDCIYFDEKDVCNEMERIILKAIKLLSHEFNSNSIIWYRNFLCKKYYKDFNNKLNRNDKENIDDRFYQTYIAEYITGKKI